MSYKKCFKCGEVKSLSEFYRHKQMADGHVNKCKDCNKRDVRENRKKNIEYYREYDRDRGNRQSVEYVRSYREKYPMKWAAHKVLGNAVRDGKIIKKHQCEDCLTESKIIHGHHDDYLKPLSVRWLCPACHKAWHDRNGEGLNAG